VISNSYKYFKILIFLFTYLCLEIVIKVEEQHFLDSKATVDKHPLYVVTQLELFNHLDLLCILTLHWKIISTVYVLIWNNSWLKSQEFC